MISSNLFEEDTDSDNTLQPFTNRRRRQRSLLPALPTGFKILLSVLLSFILGVVISMALIVQINQRKQDTDLIRQCAIHMSHYCEFYNQSTS